MLLRLTADQANRYVLRKQCLIPRARGRDVLTVVRQVGPVRASPAIAPYLALEARLEGFTRQALEESLYDKRTLVRIRGMHGRLYIVPTEDYPAYYRVTKPLLISGMGDLDALIASMLLQGTEDPGRSDDLVQRVFEVMSARGPCTLAELSALLPALNARLYHDPDRPELGHMRLGARLIPAMCAQGLLVHARPSGSWRSDLYTYAPLSYWLPTFDLESMSWEDALRRVIWRYVAAFGPVTVGDVSHWLGGVGRQHIVAALMGLDRQLVRAQLVGSTGDYYLLDAQVDELLALVEDEDRAVSLLPQRDSLLMAYSDVSRFVDDAFRDALFDRADESLGAVWADGRVVGVWWPGLREERVTVRFFEAVDPEIMALTAEEARVV